MPAGVVDQTVESSIKRNRTGYQFLYVLLIPNVTSDEDYVVGLTSNLLELGCGSRSLVDIFARHDDFGSCFCKFLSAATSDSAAAAGNYHYFVKVSLSGH